MDYESTALTAELRALTAAIKETLRQIPTYFTSNWAILQEGQRKTLLLWL